MPSIAERAAELRDRCLQDGEWPATLLDDVVRDTETLEGSRAFFTVVIEPLGDLFEPSLCDVYARLFSRVIGRPELAQRYWNIREPRVCRQNPRRVFVLSRVTIGADIAVTSVALDAAKRRFPDAEIFFTGPKKNWELFSGDPRIQLREMPYGRSGLLKDRLEARPDLTEPDSIVIDPDSRLSQLGILPVCADENYYFFESRAYGAASSDSLSVLTAKWLHQTFDVGDARPWISLPPRIVDAYDASVSLGVGENPAKCYDLMFETRLLAMLPARTCIDTGASDEEALRARTAARREQMLFKGSFANFAAIIQRSKLFVGYDSAAGHAAAASAVPMISIFRGAVCDRMFERWKPTGRGPITVIRADGEGSETLERVRAALERPQNG